MTVGETFGVFPRWMLSSQLPIAGSLRSCNPDRIVLKKSVLSGYPVKVHKKKAVVRWMFHNREDIQWFRPVDLWTKHGRRGQIKVCNACHACMHATAVVLCSRLPP